MTHKGRGLIITLGLAAGGLVATVGPAVPAFASGQVCAGIVIDDGSGTAPVPQGASAPVGSSDLDLLSAAGDTFTQNSSGLVCAINGYPANGLQNCLDASHGLYYYWSYWEGDPATNEWTYADVGPAEHTVTAGQSYVEGWRYQDPGPDSPEATKPSVKPAAAFAQACQRVTSTTTTSSNVPGGDGSAAPNAPGSSPSATSPIPNTPPTAVKAPALGTTASNRGASQSGSTVTTGGGRGPDAPQASGDASSSTTSTAIGERQPRTPAQLALTNQSRHGGSGGDPAVPIIVVVALIGILGTVAWVRWRRTPGGA
jgi:hypothetical protein